MSAKIRLSYTDDKELEDLIKLLGDKKRGEIKIQDKGQAYKKAYIELKS